MRYSRQRNDRDIVTLNIQTASKLSDLSGRVVFDGDIRVITGERICRIAITFVVV